MVQLRMLSRSIRYVVLALSSLAIVAVASPASAKPKQHHHSAGRHVHGHHHAHSKHHGRRHHRYNHRHRASRRSDAAQFKNWDDGAQQLRKRGLDNAQASIASDGAGGFSASTVVAEARRYIGTGNPTDRARLWCARFMNMVLKKTGHQGTGSDMAKSFASYGRRVSGPQVGAIAVMGRRGGGHVGVVSGVDAKGNPIVVSGNHSRRVAESVYPRSRVYAYVMPTN